MDTDASKSRLEAIRTSYDRVATAFTEAIFNELDKKPFDRELLRRFALATSGRGAMVEIGCGPGQVSRFLRDHGATVSGIDLSSAMVEQAERLNPDIQFRVGDMTALDLPDGSVAAIVAFYAIVNLTGALRQRAFSEMARVLAPGGELLLSFHVGDEVLDPKEMWGKPVEMSFYMLDPAKIRNELQSVGLSVKELIEREPYAPEVEHQTRRAYLWARKTED
jgi:ubiquinone/menaquinone biosynthesis C-methylase UbiE